MKRKNRASFSNAEALLRLLYEYRREMNHANQRLEINTELLLHFI